MTQAVQLRPDPADPSRVLLRAPFKASRLAGEVPGAVWDGARGVRVLPWDALAPVVRLLREERYAPVCDLAGRSWPPQPPMPLPIPDALTGALPLRAYQREALGRLLGQAGLLLALDMGLGKSLVAIAAGQLIGGPVLIVAPAVALEVWPAELARWLGSACDLRVLRGRKEADPERLVGLTRHSWVLTNYEALDYHERYVEVEPGRRVQRAQAGAWLPLLSAVPWRVIVADEVHNLKKRKSKRTKALCELRSAAPRAVRLGLTGTPIHNRPRDLWSVLDWIKPGCWGHYWLFAQRYAGAHEGDWGWEDTGASNQDELGYRLGWYMYRRTKAELAHLLPPKIRQIVPVQPVKADADRLEQAIRAVYVAAADVHRRPTQQEIAAILAEYSQFKAGPLAELLEGRSGRAVVFAARRDTVAALYQQHAAGSHAYRITGEIPAEQRKQILDAWRVSEGGVLFATMGVAGLGIDLSAASTAIFVDLDPVPGTLLQCEDRLWRPPQTSTVVVYYLVLRGTSDERIARLVIAKLDAHQQILGSEQITSALQRDLAGVLDSGQDAVDALAEMLAEREAEDAAHHIRAAACG